MDFHQRYRIYLTVVVCTILLQNRAGLGVGWDDSLEMVVEDIAEEQFPFSSHGYIFNR